MLRFVGKTFPGVTWATRTIQGNIGLPIIVTIFIIVIYRSRKSINVFLFKEKKNHSSSQNRWNCQRFLLYLSPQRKKIQTHPCNWDLLIICSICPPLPLNSNSWFFFVLRSLRWVIWSCSLHPLNNMLVESAWDPRAALCQLVLRKDTCRNNNSNESDHNHNGDNRD